MVSSMLESAGLTHAIIKVWLLPPKESNETKQNRAQAKWKTYTDLVWHWTEATTINTKTFLLIQQWEKQNGLLNLSYYLWQSSKWRWYPSLSKCHPNTFSTSVSKLTLQQARELGVSVRNKSVFLAFIPQGTDHITQWQKTTIDADA